MKMVDIVRKVVKNGNFVGVVYGRVGSGKSYMAYSIGKKLCMKFGWSMIYTFSLEEVISTALNREDVLIVFDEVAYYMSSYGKKEDAERVRKILQTTRVKRVSWLLVSPFGIELAKMVRRYADIVWVMEKRGVARMYRIERDYLRGKIYAVKLGKMKNTTTLEPKDIEEMNQKKTQFLEQIKSEILNGGAAQTTTTPPPLLNLF
jgi:ABC-type glutathione transport system ATPase component